MMNLQIDATSLSAEAPDWFLQAIRTPRQSKQVVRDGCRLEYQQWGDAHKPLLLLVHGNGGHANWWDFIAPSFIEHYCICAIHLAGMGNSGWREVYGFDSYAEDLIAVAEHAGHPQQITLVGHSMGGVVCLRAAENHPDRIKALIIIDSPLIFRRSDAPSEQHKPPPPTRIPFSGKKYYPDFDTALSRFRLVPPQPCRNDFLVEYVGRHSIRHYEQGWSWKFDDKIYSEFPRTQRPTYQLELIQCLLTYFHGGKSGLVPNHTLPDLQQLLKQKGPIIEIRDAHHHVLLDEPLELIEKLKTVL